MRAQSLQFLKLPVVKNFLTYSGSALVLRATTAITSFITLGLLTTSEFGLLSLINNICALLPVFLNIGLRQAFGLEYYHHNTQERLRIFHTIVLVYTLIALPLFTLGIIFQEHVNHYLFLGTASTTIMMVLYIYCFIQFFSELYLQVLRYQQQAWRQSAIQLSAALLTIASVITLVFYGNFKILGVLTSNTIGITSIALFGSYFYIKDGLFKKIKVTKLTATIGPILLLGIPFVPNILLNWMLSYGDRWVLAKLTSLHTVGIYAFADLSSQLFSMTVLLPLSSAYVPYMLKQYAEKSESLQDIENRNLKCMWYAMAVILLSGTCAYGCLYAIAPFIIPYKYMEAIQYILPILVGNTLLMGTYFSSCYLVFKKRTWTIVGTNLIAASSNIVLNYLFIPYAGIYGCVSATVISQALFFVLTMQAVVKEYNFVHIGLLTKLKHRAWALVPERWLVSSVSVRPKHEQHKFVVLITSYNNVKYYVNNLQSVLNQTYSKFRVIYVDDCSEDKTGMMVEQYLSQVNPAIEVKVIRNTQRQRKLANLYHAIHSCRPNEIIVELDGDDFLYDETVLEQLNLAYSTTNALTVYGNYQNEPYELAKKLNMKNWCSATPAWVQHTKSYRQRPWQYSGLRTYYAHLFQSIRKNDLIIEDNFLPYFHDAATYYPILEMAGTRIGFIDKPLIRRNIDSPINDFKTVNNEQKATTHYKVHTTNVYKEIQWQ